MIEEVHRRVHSGAMDVGIFFQIPLSIKIIAASYYLYVAPLLPVPVKVCGKCHEQASQDILTQFRDATKDLAPSLPQSQPVARRIIDDLIRFLQLPPKLPTRNCRMPVPAALRHGSGDANAPALAILRNNPDSSRQHSVAMSRGAVSR
jgi:hypothetical protein